MSWLDDKQIAVILREVTSNETAQTLIKGMTDKKYGLFFRGDNRSPDIIFDTGFQLRVRDKNYQDHCVLRNLYRGIYDEQRQTTGLDTNRLYSISCSGTGKNIAFNGLFPLPSLNNSQNSDETYVYIIQDKDIPIVEIFSVQQELKAYAEVNLPDQKYLIPYLNNLIKAQEIAKIRGILTGKIIGAYQVQRDWINPNDWTKGAKITPLKIVMNDRFQHDLQTKLKDLQNWMNGLWELKLTTTVIPD